MKDVVLSLNPKESRRTTQPLMATHFQDVRLLSKRRLLTSLTVASDPRCWGPEDPATLFPHGHQTRTPCLQLLSSSECRQSVQNKCWEVESTLLPGEFLSSPSVPPLFSQSLHWRYGEWTAHSPPASFHHRSLIPRLFAMERGFASFHTNVICGLHPPFRWQVIAKVPVFHVEAHQLANIQADLPYVQAVPVELKGERRE